MDRRIAVADTGASEVPLCTGRKAAKPPRIAPRPPVTSAAMSHMEGVGGFMHVPDCNGPVRSLVCRSSITGADCETCGVRSERSLRWTNVMSADRAVSTSTRKAAYKGSFYSARVREFFALTARYFSQPGRGVTRRVLQATA